MTKSLADLLVNKWEEPAEVKIIKEFVRKKYNAQVGIKMGDKSIVISAANSALAGTLRMNINQLQTELKTDKRLIIRIGN